MVAGPDRTVKCMARSCSHGQEIPKLLRMTPAVHGAGGTPALVAQAVASGQGRDNVKARALQSGKTQRNFWLALGTEVTVRGTQLSGAGPV